MKIVVWKFSTRTWLKGYRHTGSSEQVHNSQEYSDITEPESESLLKCINRPILILITENLKETWFRSLTSPYTRISNQTTSSKNGLGQSTETTITSHAALVWSDSEYTSRLVQKESANYSSLGH
jgi:hypothetical protein